MRRFACGISLGLILALASLAEAKTVSIDFTGASPASQGLALVNNKDGAIVMAQRGGKNVAMTGNSDANRYLYLAIDPAFKQGLKSVWLTVVYFDEGKDAFQVQYDGQDDPHTPTDSKMVTPEMRTKFDQKVFTHQTWHLTGWKLAGGEEGGADLRIDDMKDGPEFIGSVTLSDADPDFVGFPYAVNPITLDGKIDPGEWDGAYVAKMDRPEQVDGGIGNWGGPNDFSGTYSFKWDENALYILGQVVDATPRMNDQGSYGPPAYWAGDGMEQFIGLDDSDPEVTDHMIPDTDFKVTISLGATPMWATEDRGVFVDGNPTTDLGAIGNNIAIVNTDNPKGYVFEMRIPWNIHKNTPPKAGQRIRWTMYANNGKELPSDQDTDISPTGRGNFNSSVAAWQRAMLLPKP
jgi:Carbohydrate family 9 binding domain-like